MTRNSAHSVEEARLAGWRWRLSTCFRRSRRLLEWHRRRRRGRAVAVTPGWGEDDNWSTDDWPRSGWPTVDTTYDVILDRAAPANVHMQGIGAGVNSVTIADNGRLETFGGLLTLANPAGFGVLKNDGELIVNSAPGDAGHGTLQIGANGVGGMIENDGLISVEGTGNIGIQISGTVELEGNGTLRLSGPEANGISRSQDTSVSNVLIQHSDHRLEGGGFINNISLTNFGTILANDASQSLEITPDLVGVVNHGLMLASNGGTLKLRGLIVNTAIGELGAALGSRLELEDADVTGSRISAGPGSLLAIIDRTYLHDITVLGNMQLRRGGGH